MTSEPQPQPARSSKGLIWTGRVMSALPVLALLMSGVMKLVQPAGMAEGFEKLGFPLHLATGLGIVELTATVSYLIPQTSVLGAILVTGYLGGAIATHVRLEEFSSVVPPVILGLLVWGGLSLRCKRVRALIPFRT